MAALLLGIALGFWSRRSGAIRKGTLRLSGLGASVEVRRDRGGVPHIYAADRRDLLYAQGFVPAQDPRGPHWLPTDTCPSTNCVP